MFSKTHVCNYTHPMQHSPFPDRLKLPYPDEEIVWIRGRCLVHTRWCCYVGESRLRNYLWERHTIDNRKVHAVFREASARNMLHLDKSITSTITCLTVHLCRKRLSIYNWNPGPRRGKGAFEKQIAGKWHVVILQEAIEYVDHELLTNRFHVIHYGECAVLFNKDTFLPDIKIKSIYLQSAEHDLPDKVFEGGSGLVIKCVISRAQPHGLPLFTVMSLHINNK